MNQHLTITVADGSDQGGLKIGQQINVRGQSGRWKVTKVHSNAPPTYDVERLPNRQQRRKAAAQKEKVS